MKNKKKKRPQTCEEWFNAFEYYYEMLPSGLEYFVTNKKNQTAVIEKGDMIAKLRDWDASTLNAFIKKKYFPQLRDIDIEKFEKFYSLQI